MTLSQDSAEAREPALPARWLNLLLDLRRARRQYDSSWRFILCRGFVLLRRHGFRPREALLFGLFDPAIPEAALAASVPKRRLTRLQARVNPRFLESLTEDKAVFYAYCAGLGLPVPRFLGVSAIVTSYSGAGAPLVRSEDWEAFAATLPDEFVVKPSRGVYGRGVRVFRRDGDAFVDNLGSRHRPGDLGAATRTDARYRSFVLQERLRSHPELERLSATDSLQTVRIVTWVREDGRVDLPLSFFRVITGAAVVDNFDSGRTGNLCCLVDTRDGTLETAVGIRPGGLGLTWHVAHAKTGVAFEGFPLPYWREACGLVRRAAILFLPMRTIGWDVALTPQGPVLVEGNMFWDPASDLVTTTPRPQAAQGMVDLLDQLERLPDVPAKA